MTTLKNDITKAKSL